MMLNDLKYALRQLRQAPGFTLTAVVLGFNHELGREKVIVVVTDYAE
jgi:hypothetical protein